MNTYNINRTISAWVTAQGPAWADAVRAAAKQLLEDYSSKGNKYIPIELHRLAASLDATIVKRDDLKGDAVLLPVLGGFRILVASNMPVGRYRTSVAHELAHTLFFTNDHKTVPARTIPHTHREEAFCFDVARHVLAPKEHLESLGVFHEENPSVIFNKLTDNLLLSRPLAARIMLADYALVKGIAGRWTRKEDGWKQEYGSSSASSDLPQTERKKLRLIVSKYLESGIEPTGFTLISSVYDTVAKGKSVFILLTKHSL